MGGKQKKKIDVAALPQFCDFSCPHASFAPAEVSGACRRDVAVHCTLLDRLNAKHASCLARAQRRAT